MTSPRSFEIKLLFNGGSQWIVALHGEHELGVIDRKRATNLYKCEEEEAWRATSRRTAEEPEGVIAWFTYSDSAILWLLDKYMKRQDLTPPMHLKENHANAENTQPG